MAASAFSFTAQDGSIDAPSRSDVDGPLALLLASADSLHALAGDFVAEAWSPASATRASGVSP